MIAAALAGKPAPRVPNGMLAVHSCAGPAGYSLLDALIWVSRESGADGDG